jgi:hypothetical protein
LRRALPDLGIAKRRRIQRRSGSCGIGQNQGVPAGEAIAELQGPPVFTIPEATTPDGAPVAPGFYAWWASRGAIPGVPAPAHPVELEQAQRG